MPKYGQKELNGKQKDVSGSDLAQIYLQSSVDQ
ncbi:hypothetical protein BFJ67_g11120 [Fusarium oxysporum f. sp. cepae]|nr:hypothetical protein BFJ67_g11120 [Fusarium oxysporum f. sp. cepae]